MGQVRVDCFTISIDGFGAGVDQSLEHPLGKGTESLHEWMIGTRTFMQRVMGQVVRHRQRGADLVWEAYNLDIGGDE